MKGFVVEGPLSWKDSLFSLIIRVTHFKKTLIKDLNEYERHEAIYALKEILNELPYPPAAILDFHEEDLFLEFRSPYFLSLRGQTDLFRFLDMMKEYILTIPYITTEICVDRLIENQKEVFKSLDLLTAIKKSVIFYKDFHLQNLLPSSHAAGITIEN